MNLKDKHNDVEQISTMKRRKLNLIEYAKNGVSAVNSTFYRFPLTILLFVALAIITIYRIEMPYEQLKYVDEILNRITAVIALGVPFTLSGNLILERFWQKNLLIKIGIYVAELLLLTLYYFYLLPNMEMVAFVRLLLITIALTLAFLFIPYLYKKENYEVYITKILTRAITTAFFTVVLALGLIATLFAVKSLLYNDLSENFFIYTWILAWFIFAPIYFLYGFPQNSDSFNLEHYNKVLKVLLLYIVLPIISIYSIVLYLYFGKIVITQVWPNGIVSYLVLSYTAVGIASIFLISPLIKNNKWVKMFTSIFTKAIFPLLGMMFISISIRIGDFGFTVNRYFILVIGIWATFAMIFINFNKGKRNIILPISLAIVAFLTVSGPWNAFNISKISQSQRFYNILNKYDMIQDGKVVNNNSSVERNDQNEISAILDYFNRSYSLSELKYLPNDFELKNMEDVFGFSKIRLYTNTRSYYNYGRYEELPVVITGYDVVFDYKTFSDSKIDSVRLKNEEIKISVNDKYMMTILRDGTEVYRYDVHKYIEALNEKYGINMKDDSIPPDDLVIVGENDEVEVMIVFNRINGFVNLDYDEIEIKSIETDIYVKVK